MVKFRKDLSAPGLWSAVREVLSRARDPRGRNLNTEIPVGSALMSACAMFALKFPSLLQFDQGRVDPTIAENLRTLFHVSKIPSDTQMREIADKIDPQDVLRAFDRLLALAQRGKVLEQYEFLDRGYLLSIDGTGYFESQNTHCDSCCIKIKSDGTKHYYHQFLPGVLVHPNQKQVIPLSAEPILLQDGHGKNDCERRATERLLRRIRTQHPKLKLIVLQDALHSNNPNLKTLRDLGMDFIITVKEKSHAALFQTALAFTELDEAEVLEFQEEGVLHQFRIKNDLWLNVEFKQKVNFIEYFEYSKGGKTRHWGWITSMPVTKKNVMQIMKGARTRWKIENETFNTLKNQGYQFEHNFGHGYRNLSTNFALLMLLAFAVDQIQELCCKVFQTAREACFCRTHLWETMRVKFTTFIFRDWMGLFHSIFHKKRLIYDTS